MSPLAPATAAAATRIYWVDFLADSIQCAATDGSGYLSLVHTTPGSSYFVRLDVNGDWMYWTEAEDNVVYRSHLDGTAPESLFVTGVGTDSAPYGLDVDPAAGKVYWTESGVPKAIRRANLNGSGVEDLVTTDLSNPFDLHLDLAGGKMYWADLVLDWIQRANLDGTGVETVVSGLGTPYDFDLDLVDGKVYWTDHTQKLIARANLDGSQRDTLVVTPASCLYGLAVDHDGGWVYFTHCNEIYRVNLAATTLELILLPGLNQPWGLALESAPPTAVEPKPGPPRLALGAPRPTPASAEVTLDLTLAAGARVRAAVFDARGRHVATVLERDLPAGNHPIVWDGRDAAGRVVPSGVYRLRASAGKEDAHRPIVIAR